MRDQPMDGWITSRRPEDYPMGFVCTYNTPHKTRHTPESPLGKWVQGITPISCSFELLAQPYATGILHRKARGPVQGDGDERTAHHMYLPPRRITLEAATE